MIHEHNSLLSNILTHKRTETGRQQIKVPLDILRQRVQSAPPIRDFATALRRPAQTQPTTALIAEVKKASPSRGVLLEQFDHLEIARTYIMNGATALSVLTDIRFFQGSLKYLEGIRKAQQENPVMFGDETCSVPLLRKDFLLEPYQIYESRAYGADAVLLIVAALDNHMLRDLLCLTHDLGMQALVEVHTATELARALDTGARIVGVNNRDLHNFETSLETTECLAKMLPDGDARPLLVSESGIHTPADIVRVRKCGADAVLVGEALVTAPDIGVRVRELAHA